MAFGSIDLTTVSRAQDYTIVKQNEDNKGFVDQSVIGQQNQKNTRQRMQEVNQHDNADYHQRGFDAREKGDNEYAGDGGKNRKKQKPHEQVIVNGHKSFDMKV